MDAISIGDFVLDEIRKGIAAERERCARIADKWSLPDNVRLAAGEMTAQEMRTAQAIARAVAASIRNQH